MKLAHPFKDQEGNTYRTVIVGDYIWTIDNYCGTYYRNGDRIQMAVDDDTYLKLGSSGVGAWCLNYNDKKRTSTFGYLYNWFAVHDERGFSPEGWRVPNEQDWKALENYMQTKINDGNEWADLMQGLNMSFSGSRGINGAFGGAEKSGYWWKFLPEVAHMSWGRRLQSNGNQLEPIDGFQRFGFSVRLIKNCL